MNVNTAFKFLNIAETASVEEVNASYRRLLMEYHPDRNKERSEWSHQMTIRLTEAFTAVIGYLQSKLASIRPDKPAKAEPDSRYSLSMQARIAKLYDILLEHLNSYYAEGMDKLYLREEGTLRQRYKLTLYRLSQTLGDLQDTQVWTGSALQHRQINVIYDFAATFYENMRIKPKEHDISNREIKAEKLYHAGSRALDTSICKGVLKLEHSQGLICPGARHRAEQNFMLLLTSYSNSCYIPETLIKLYLLRSLSALCEHLEASMQTPAPQ